MRAFPLVVALVVLAAVAVQAIPGLRQDVNATSAAMVPVVTLAAGTAGTTALGASRTSGVTTGVALPANGTSVEVLKVLRGTTDWTVELVGLGVTGAAAGDQVTLTMVGATTQTQVVLTGTTITQAVGTRVSLAPGDPDVQIMASGNCAGTCYFGLWIAVRPPGLSTPVMAYLYELYVT